MAVICATMWASVSTFILRYRLPILIGLILFSIFMGWKARDVRMNYKFSGVLPPTDSTFLAYEAFISQFHEDGNVMAVGIENDSIWTLEHFQKWSALASDLRRVTVAIDSIRDGQKVKVEVPAVDSVFSSAHLYSLVRNDSLMRFEFVPLLTEAPKKQEDIDSLRYKLSRLPFYEGILHNENMKSGLMMVFVNEPLFNSERRGNAIEQIMELTDKFTTETGIKTYLSGLPYIRTQLATKVKSELQFFTVLAGLVCALLLYVFFRSFSVIFVCLTVVAIGVVSTIGTMVLCDYPITMLTGLIPPLIIIMGVPNCIYLVTKYHQEYARHRNKMKALSRVIVKVGNAAFLINATTAVGFATFMFTSSDIVQQFGLVATINVMITFILSILVFPILYSYMPPPGQRHLGHLETRWLRGTIEWIVRVITRHRRKVYWLTVFITVIGIAGITLLKTTGNIVDDLPEDDRVLTDLKWFEREFNGVMPFEIMVDAKKKGAITKSNNLEKIGELQDLLGNYQLETGDTLIHPFSRSLSIVDAEKFIRQAFYSGDPDYYDFITKNESSFIAPYLEGDQRTRGLELAFLDSAHSRARVSAHIADIGTKEMERILSDLRPQVDSIFDPQKFDVTITGTSVVFLEGTNYLVSNLFSSFLLAVLVIALMMAALFRSMRMVLISLVPNIIPQILTAGMMGYLGVAIKPSTLLVFSIALGITVDNTIHFLAKYRQELKLLKWNIRDSILIAIRETASSMMYTSIVLLFGFGIFVFSEFDGTQALGILLSFTLFVAMITNVLLLPSLLLSFERSLTTKAFSEPFLQIIDEEDELHYEQWEIRRTPPEGLA